MSETRNTAPMHITNSIRMKLVEMRKLAVEITDLNVDMDADSSHPLVAVCPCELEQIRINIGKMLANLNQQVENFV